MESNGYLKVGSIDADTASAVISDHVTTLGHYVLGDLEEFGVLVGKFFMFDHEYLEWFVHRVQQNWHMF